MKSAQDISLTFFLVKYSASLKNKTTNGNFQ